VVRQQIIFRTVHDLRECLAAIASDPEATILRHKNRLSLEYDSVQSAGVSQGLAGCCRVLQCFAVRSVVYDVVQSADVLQRVAACCRVLRCVAVHCGALQCGRSSILRCNLQLCSGVAGCVLQGYAVCCRVMR